MGKMRSGWDFLPEHGFHGSSNKGMTQVSGYSRAKPKFAKGGKVGGPTDSKTGKSFPAAKIPTPQVGKKGPDLNIKAPGNHLAFAKGGKVGGFKSEDSEPHESQAGYTHNEPEQGEHLEAARGGAIRRAKGGPVHNHFRSGHKIESHPIGLHHPHNGHPDKHHAPPHKAEGHKLYKAGGGIARPTGMPRAPVLGMKRVRHSPSMPGGGMGRPQPGIPGMGSQGTPAFGQQPMKPRGMAGGIGSMGGPGLKTGGRAR